MSNLRSLRAEKNLVLEDVAKAICINTSTLSRVERGVQFPSRGTVKKLAKFYCKTPSEIYALASEEPEPKAA